VNEQDKEEFLTYLDENGILDKLTDVLIMLHSEQETPLDPIEYVRKNICVDNPDVVEINELKTQIQNADIELAKLQKIRDELKVRLEQFQTELQLEVEDYEDEAVKVADNDEYVD
ncbi:c-Myc-binding protein, partial [Aphis craccivora]